MDYVSISNSGIVWALCGITVFIAFIQALLYTRMATKTAKQASIPDEIPKKAFKIGDRKRVVEGKSVGRGVGR